MWDIDAIINKATILYGEDQPFEVIAKYSGDILELNSLENVFVEVLNSSFAIITLTLENVRTVLSYDQINYVEIPSKLSIVQNGDFFLDEYYREPYICPTNDATLTGKGVLVSILDTGIQYLHQDFRNSDGTTRILYIWDQSSREGTPPENFFEGSVYTKAMIDRALATQTPLPTNDPVGHGTMVAGISVGNGNESNGLYKGVAPEASIMAVKLGTDQYDSFAMTTAFMRAIKFSYDMARKEDMPLVINVSYGSNFGTHLGNTLFEEYIDDMVTYYPSTFVVATGNEGDAGHHYESILIDNTTEEIHFNISGGLRELEMSLWKSFVDEFSIQIISPTGEKTDFMSLSNSVYTYTFSNSEIKVLYSTPTPYQIEQEIYINFKFNSPTTSQEKWTIIVKTEDIVDGRLQIWLPTVEEVTKQTNFVNSSKSSSLTVPATAKSIIAVGAYDTSTNRIADFSGRGLNPNGQIKPDIAAPGVDVLTTNNLLSYDVTSGTSFAAPFVTGAAAILMQYGIVNSNELFLYGEKLKAYLQRGARRSPDVVYPNRDFGYGRLCLQNTLDILIALNETKSLQTTEDLDASNIEILIEKSPKLLDAIKNTTYINKNIDFQAFDDFIIAELPQNKLQEFKNTNPDLNIERAIPLSQMATDNFDYLPKPTSNKRAGNGVLIAIIDYDINIFDDCFINPNGTSKIKYYLDLEQDGLEFNNLDINSMKRNTTPKELSHGTTIARIASNMSPSASFILVNLKKACPHTLKEHLISKGIAFSSIDVIKSLHYVTTRSNELNMPVSIGLCLGSNFGSHQGDTLFEKYLSKLSTQNNLSICVATGNEADKKTHLERNLSHERREFFSINVCESTESLPIFIYTEHIYNFSLSITTPKGESFNFTPNSLIESFNYNYKFENFSIYIDSNIPKQQLIIKLKNTYKGIYNISYTPYIHREGKLHAYLPTSPHLSSNTFFATPSPNFTSTIPSTAQGIISVGSFSDNTSSSGRGPNRNMDIRPTIVSTTPNNDSTSFATAKIMGISANLLQLCMEQNIDITTLLIKSILIDVSTKDTDFTYPNNVEGHGRVDTLIF